ncbi:hypothetical protein WJX72_006242 [[Myrmecia] bisecta]|uniref:Uncharacterized protein n=1 Tax=[Myrmecia] bisecta TaxID=41462 RepID=A0AAW1P5U8_9CHLO
MCTNKTCKKQGSAQAIKFAQDLGLPDVKVEAVGCLGNCGNGPNMVLLPDKLLLNHVSTPAKMADILRTLCGSDISEPLLKATELRLAGNDEARVGNLHAAVELYTQGLEVAPAQMRHLLYANRSGARRGLGDSQGALDDANAAAAAAPPGFTTAFVRQVEAHVALQQFREAAQALEEGARREPSFAKSADYKQLAGGLQQVLQRR